VWNEWLVSGMTPPPPPKISAKQFEIIKARQAARRASDAAVIEFKKQERLFATRRDVKQVIFDHIPAYNALHSIAFDARSICIAVSYSPSLKKCVATVWFQIPVGTPPNVDRDRSRILLAHIAALAISAVFFKQADSMIPDAQLQDDAKKRSDSINRGQSNIRRKQSDIAAMEAEIGALKTELDASFDASRGDKRARDKHTAFAKQRMASIKKKTKKIEDLKSNIGLLEKQVERHLTTQKLEKTTVYDNNFLDEVNATPALVFELVSHTRVDPLRVTIANFPGPLNAVATDPASTQVQVLLDGADSSLANGALRSALNGDPVDYLQISNYVVASFAQMLYGYGLVYVGSFRLASKDVATIRTKLCVVLDRKLNGRSDVLLQDDGTPWAIDDYKAHVYNTVSTEELDKADSLIQRILRKIAIAIVVNSVEVLDQDALRHLHILDNTEGFVDSRLVGNRRDFFIVDGVDTPEFLRWATTRLGEENRFRLILDAFRNPRTGIASTVFNKLLNIRTRMVFSDDEMLFLQFALGVDGNVTQPAIDQMVNDTSNPRYLGLQQYNTEMQRVQDEKKIAQRANIIERANAKKDKDAEQAEMRVAIVEFALFGATWVEQRHKQLDNKQLAYLYQQVSMQRREVTPPPGTHVKLGPIPLERPLGRDNISRAPDTAHRDELYRYDIRHPEKMHAFVRWLRTLKSIVGDLKKMRLRLHKQACVAILGRNLTIGLQVEDYIRYVQGIELPVTDDGVMTVETSNMLVRTPFARNCKTADIRRKKQLVPEVNRGQEDNDGDDDIFPDGLEVNGVQEDNEGDDDIFSGGLEVNGGEWPEELVRVPGLSDGDSDDVGELSEPPPLPMPPGFP